MSAPSSTLFTAPTEWHWLIIAYFFLGGIAGGAFFLGALMDLFGSPLLRPLACLGYLVAFPLTVVCGLLLTFDLRRPLRFWHMLLQSETLRPMFKAWSPMSVGSWGLLLFGFFALLAFLGALAEGRGGRWRRFAPLRSPGVLGTVVAVLGVIVCGAMIYGLGWTNWARLLVWLVIGMIFYFGYGRSHSRLERA